MASEEPLKAGKYATVKVKIETERTPIPLRNEVWHFHRRDGGMTEFYLSPYGRLKVHETYLSSVQIAKELAEAVSSNIKRIYGESAEITVKIEETRMFVFSEKKKKIHTEIAKSTIEKMKND